MTRSPAVRVAALCLAAAGLLYLLEVLRPPVKSIFWTEVFNFGHAPLFGGVALAAYGIVRVLRGPDAEPRLRDYLVALAASVGLGLVTEAFQFYGTRDADPWDAVRNVLGAVSFLLFAATFERTRLVRLAPPHVPLAAMLRIVAVAVLLAALVPLGAVSWAYVARDRAFPMMCDFQDYWLSHFVRTRHVELTLAYLPEPWNVNANDFVGRILFSKADYPRVTLLEPVPDWRAYDHLVFDAWSELDRPVELSVRIDAGDGPPDEADRFRARSTVVPGAQTVAIPLTAFGPYSGSARPDFSHVRRVTVYAAKPEDAFTLYLDDLRLTAGPPTEGDNLPVPARRDDASAPGGADRGGEGAPR